MLKKKRDGFPVILPAFFHSDRVQYPDFSGRF